MSFVAEEIASQPECWSRAIALAAERPAGLPETGERVAVIGCGTSWFMAQAYAALREAAGLGRTDALPASELPAGRRYDGLIALSRSGTTTEVVHALGAGLSGRTVAITAVAGSPVAHAADATVVLDWADEESVVQTRFATSALTLLRAHAGAPPVLLEAAAQDAESALDAPLPVDPAPVREWTFVGRGWTVGLAHEAALKLRESAQAWTESYPALEYRHGPISITGPDSVLWSFGPLDPALAAQVRAVGGNVVDPALDPLASLVLAQRTAVALAEARGLDPDRPRNLTRSVVLEGDASGVLS